MTRILTPEQVAEMLGCTPETVREKTPHIIPGAKFGRDWVYSESLVVRAVERMSTVVLVDSLNGPLPKSKNGMVKAADVLAYRDAHQVSLSEAFYKVTIATKDEPPSLNP
jgi:hypothetical protein